MDKLEGPEYGHEDEAWGGKGVKGGKILIVSRAPPSVTHLLLGIKARTGVIDDQIGQNG